MRKDSSVRSGLKYVAGNMINVVTRQGTRWSTSEDSYPVDTNNIKVEHTFEIGVDSRVSAEELDGAIEVPLDRDRV